MVLEKSYKEYLEGFTDIATGEARRGYLEVVKELNEKFPNPGEIVKEKVYQPPINWTNSEKQFDCFVSNQSQR